MGDPFDGALWSGPPYSSRLWRRLADHRNPGSPAWLPRFRDGSFVRFMNQHGEAAEPSGPNAALGADAARVPPICERPRDLFRLPQPLSRAGLDAAAAAPDVSPQLRWYPIVTLFQLMLDMFMAIEAPIGYGHVYAPAH
jgi:uncharacterized membrane protein